MSLSNTPSIESLGAPNTLVVTVQDRTTTPTLSISNASVVEGNTGTTTDVIFTISLSAATGRTVNFDFATGNINAFGASKCNNVEGVDYIPASGSLSLQPGSTAIAVVVKVCGDTSAESNEVFRVLLSNVTGATLAVNQGIATIVNDDALVLLLEESAPNKAAAVEAVLATRDPFTFFMPDWYTPGINENTRLMFFAQNLQLNPGELPSAVVVRFTTIFGGFVQVPAEDVRPLRDTEFTQVIVRVPSILTSGTYTITLAAHAQLSNSGTVIIGQ